jgi:adenine deaminase
MWVFLREGSASRNIRALAPTVVAHGIDHAALCTDDREPSTLIADGHVNDCVAIAVKCGVPEIDAILLATANPAAYHGLHRLGSLGPGHQADVLAFDTLGPWVPASVWQAGTRVARGGTIEPGAVPAAPPPGLLYDTVRIGRLPSAGELTVQVAEGTVVRAVGVESNSLTTRSARVTVGSGSGSGAGSGSGSGEDLAFAAVVERHHATGRVGRGFVTGFGLTRGALASTVAHDAHNVVCVGADGEDMAVAVARLAEIGGGQVAVRDGRVVAEVALPLAGLMSDRPAGEVAHALEVLGRAAASELGVTVAEPFMQLSFIALSVIPALRLTDGGLVDVDAFAHVETIVA